MKHVLSYYYYLLLLQAKALLCKLGKAPSASLLFLLLLLCQSVKPERRFVAQKGQSCNTKAVASSSSSSSSAKGQTATFSSSSSSSFFRKGVPMEGNGRRRRRPKRSQGLSFSFLPRGAFSLLSFLAPPPPSSRADVTNERLVGCCSLEQGQGLCPEGLRGERQHWRSLRGAILLEAARPKNCASAINRVPKNNVNLISRRRRRRNL